MLIKSLLDEDFINYKKPSMFIAFPFCTFKCEKECGIQCCQNSQLVKQKNIDVPAEVIVNHYINNPITSAITFGGLEPFDSWDDVKKLITLLRKETLDDIIIYTGYNKDEVLDKLTWLTNVPNIIVKFGRFIPNDQARFDEILGVSLASKNQYAEVVSE